MASTDHQLVVTTYDTDADILAAVDAGYLLKGARRDELHAAVRAATRARPTLAPRSRGDRTHAVTVALERGVLRVNERP